MPSVLWTVARICKITQFFNEIEVCVFWEYISLLKTGSHESITVLLMQGLCSFLNIATGCDPHTNGQHLHEYIPTPRWCNTMLMTRDHLGMKCTPLLSQGLWSVPTHTHVLRPTPSSAEPLKAASSPSPADMFQLICHLGDY